MDPLRKKETRTTSRAGVATPKISAQSSKGAGTKTSPTKPTQRKPSECLVVPEVSRPNQQNCGPTRASGSQRKSNLEPQERPQERARSAPTEKALLSAVAEVDRPADLPAGPELPAAPEPPLPRAGSRRNPGARPKKAPVSAEINLDALASPPEGPDPPAAPEPPLPRAGSRRNPGARPKKAPVSAEINLDAQASPPEGPNPPTAPEPPLPRAGSRRNPGARPKKAPVSAEINLDAQASPPEGPNPPTAPEPPLPRAGSRRNPGARPKKAPVSAEGNLDAQASPPEGPELPAAPEPPLPKAGSRRNPGARPKKAPVSAEGNLDAQVSPPNPPTAPEPPLPRAGSSRRGGARPKKAAPGAEEVLEGLAVLYKGQEPPAASERPLPRAVSCPEGGTHSTLERRPRSRPTEVPVHDSLVPASSVHQREAAPGAWKPRAVLEKLRLRREEISVAAEVVNRIVGHLQRSMQSWKSEFKGVALLHAGSYYEQVKVSAPNEFDVMFELEAPRIKLEEYRNSGSHYFVKFKRNPRGNPLNEFVEGEVLSASKMLAKFRKLIQEEIKKIDDTDVIVDKKKKGCPAVTLLIKKPQEISVDIILALKVQSSWPASTREGMPIDNWLSRKVKRSLRQQPFYLVPKPAKEGNTFQEDTWRLSFSHIEKYILKNHGGSKKCCEKNENKCCRKDCLKRMKYLLERLKEKFGDQKKLDKFCSYQVKTAFFHVCVENPCDSQWQYKDLELCFDRFVEYFLQCLKTEHLPHFFIPAVNLLSPDKINRTCKEFLSKEIEYERNNAFPVFGKF
ncbi:PREDICTED: cyclic GMP-AMP synthase [Miniopterus natalensis]|uniref:cyclic GMP-AMP synthase n=1 Tax=Miniopterus natalensis TaxID=291302 RepID=UPI0007A6B6A5|nr:PREDICTED: cyclic GMP-AMP synthase [Miniopterus natalensis]